MAGASRSTPPGGRGRVLMIVENLPVPVDRRVWQEATTLRQAGYDVSVICPVGHGCDARREVLDGIHIYRHPLPVEARGPLGFALEYGAALCWEMWLAWRVWFTRGFDAIHACNPPDHLFLVAAPFALLGARYLFDQHDAYPHMYEVKFQRRGLLHALVRLTERLNFRWADVVIASSASLRDRATSSGNVDPERVHLVRSGPDLAHFPGVTPAKHWHNGRRHLVGYVGVMGSQDGVDLLLRGVRYLVHERGRTDVQFVCAGDGPELSGLRTLARELEVDPYVTFPGFLSDRVALHAAIGSADVCVTPDPSNIYNDTCFLNKVVEYMALGRAQVMFDLPEGRAAAQDAALYAPPNDPRALMDRVVELLDDPARARTMGATGRQRIEAELAWCHEAPALLRAYEQLFAR